MRLLQLNRLLGKKQMNPQKLSRLQTAKQLRMYIHTEDQRETTSLLLLPMTGPLKQAQNLLKLTL